MALLDSRKIPAPPDALSPPINHFSVVDDPTGSPPPEKMSSELALASPAGCEVLRESSLTITESPKIKNPITTKQRNIIAIVSLVVGIIIFIIAYVGMKQKIGIGVFNQPILQWMISHRQPIITDIAKIITTIANPIVFASIVGLIVIIWAIAKREIWRPILLVGAMATAAATSIILKKVIQDARPPQIDMIPMFETDFSFPSGHTISMAVFLLVIGYLIYSRHHSALRFWIWIIIACIGTGLIALSRLYLGYHWLTDVVASVGLALIILAIVIIIDSIFFKPSEV